MGTIAFASAKSSPGVSTTVAALVAAWPADRDLFVAELDPAGGDLVIRFDLAAEPGLVSLAAAGRRDLRRETFLAHTQALPFEQPGGALRRVLVAPVAADQSSAALATLRIGLLAVLGALGGDVLIDCGRLDPGSPVTEVAAGADLLVVVTRPVLSEVHHLATRLAGLNPKALSLVTIGDQPYPVTEVATAVGATALGTMPLDPRAAQALASAGPGTLKNLRRSPLLRDARAVAEGLAAWLGPLPTAEDPGWTPPPGPPPPAEAGPAPGAAVTLPPSPPPGPAGAAGAEPGPGASPPVALPPPPAAPPPPGPPGRAGVEAGPGSQHAPPAAPPPPPGPRGPAGVSTAESGSQQAAAVPLPLAAPGAEAGAVAGTGAGANGHEREPQHFRRSGGEARR
jgi:MinD-like ATPase involved in chromosome partitioning or flagellar assembly